MGRYDMGLKFITSSQITYKECNNNKTNTDMDANEKRSTIRNSKKSKSLNWKATCNINYEIMSHSN